MNSLNNTLITKKIFNYVLNYVYSKEVCYSYAFIDKFMSNTVLGYGG